MKRISKFLFNKVLGWKISNHVPNPDKCVIAVAPHTSNWDFIIGKLAYNSLGRPANFLIKKEWFVFPFNIFFKRNLVVMNCVLSCAYFKFNSTNILSNSTVVI